MSGRPTQSQRRSITILGSTVDLLPIKEVMTRVSGWVEHPDGKCHRITVTGFHGLWAASKDVQLQRVLNNTDLWIPDGIAPVWIARLRGHRKVTRIPGAELMQAVFEQGQEGGYRHFFYGDTQPTLDKLAQVIPQRWPGNSVVGGISPPFRAMTQGELDAHLDEINAAKPDFIWVGLGLPKQDRWIHEHAGRLQAPVAVGVGAAFAFIAGTVKRAPAWVGRIGMEWAYRLAKEPRKCWRRCCIEGPQFVLRVLGERTEQRRP